MGIVTIDLHVDLPWQIYKHQPHENLFSLREGVDWVQTDLPRMQQGGLDQVVVALYLSDGVQDRLGPEASYSLIRHQVGWMQAHKLPHKLALEGGRLINRNLGWLDELKDLGIVYMTLTHNRTTDWADSATDVLRHNGLTAFGKRIIRNLEILGILPDVSHASDDTARDVLGMATGPVIASHSGVQVLIDHPRNLNNYLIKEIHESGGVVGIPFATRFVGSKDGVVQAIDHIAQLTGSTGGISIGSDLDGAQTVIKDASEWSFWIEPLKAKGYTQADIDGIAGGNFMRLLQ